MREVRLIDANAAIVLITQKYNIDRVADENVAFAMIDLVSDIAEMPTITPDAAQRWTHKSNIL